MTDSNDNTGSRNTGNWNAGSRNTGNCNTGDCNTGDCNTGDCNTGDSNTGDSNAGNWNTGDSNAGNWNTGDSNTGNWNTGDSNTGFFNTVTPSTIMVFNGHMIDRETFIGLLPLWLYRPSPTTWVPDSKMSDQEKVDHPTFQTCGGYLRNNDWLAEWKKAFDGASPEDIQMVRDLPGFDAAVFQEITGLDLAVVCAPEIIEVNGVKYVRADK